jgi:hypothetical protein
MLLPSFRDIGARLKAKGTGFLRRHFFLQPFAFSPAPLFVAISIYTAKFHKIKKGEPLQIGAPL